MIDILNFLRSRQLFVYAATGLTVISVLSLVQAMFFSLPSQAGVPKPLVIRITQHVVAVTNEGPDGSVWVLVGKASERKVLKISTITGKVIRVESVSTRANAVAQTPGGDLILGTSNGRSSAVVEYGPEGDFVFAVHVAAPVVSVSTNPAGTVFYAIEQKGRTRSLFVFDKTEKGFTYNIDNRTVGLASVNGGHDIWLLQSNGIMKEMTLIPYHSITTRNLKTNATAIASSSQSNLMFILTSGNHKKVIAINESGSRANIAVPKQSNSIALSQNGAYLLDTVTTSITGDLIVFPL